MNIDKKTIDASMIEIIKKVLMKLASDKAFYKNKIEDTESPNRGTIFEHPIKLLYTEYRNWGAAVCGISFNILNFGIVKITPNTETIEDGDEIVYYDKRFLWFFKYKTKGTEPVYKHIVTTKIEIDGITFYTNPEFYDILIETFEMMKTEVANELKLVKILELENKIKVIGKQFDITE